MTSCNSTVLITIASWAYLYIHKKLIRLLNVNNSHDGLIIFVNHAIKNHFILFSVKKLCICASITNELLDLLQTYKLEPDPKTLVLDWLTNYGNNSHSKKCKLDCTICL